MAGFKVNIKRSVRIKAPVLTRAQRVEVGRVALAVVKQRIQRAIDADDAPAKPLGKRYAIQKTRRGLGNRRNWTFTGAMLNSLRVTVATASRIVISPTDDQKQKMAYNQVRCEMFALSPSDEKEVNTIFELRALQNARGMFSTGRSGEFL